jgi:hypothetical protein
MKRHSVIVAVVITVMIIAIPLFWGLKSPLFADTSKPWPNPTDTPIPTPTPVYMKIGVVAHDMTADQANFLASNGVNWIRADVSIDPNDTLFTNWDKIYRLAKDNNLSLIGTLLPQTMNLNNSFTLDDWNQTVKTAVQEYGNYVSAWEIWNEPTVSEATCGYFNGTAQRYVDLMRVAYPIIKEYSNAPVLGFGGLPLYSSTDPLRRQSLTFAQEVVNLGGMRYCDAISLHAYPWGHYGPFVESAFNSSLSLYRQMAGGKEIWITEAGQKSQPDQLVTYSSQEQSDYLNASYTFLKSQNVSAYFWYELSDDNNPHQAFGLYCNDSTTAKTALYTYLDLAKDTTLLNPSITENAGQPLPQVDLAQLIKKQHLAPALEAP